MLYCTQLIHFQAVCVVYSCCLSNVIHVLILDQNMFTGLIHIYTGHIMLFYVSFKDNDSSNLSQFCYFVLGKITRLGVRSRSLARRGGFHDLSLVTVLT